MEMNCACCHYAPLRWRLHVSVTPADSNRGFYSLSQWFLSTVSVSPRKMEVCPLGQSARAAIENYHRRVILGGLNNRNLFSHSTAGWKSEVKVSAGLFPLKPHSLPGRWSSSPCVSHMVFPLSVQFSSGQSLSHVRLFASP